MYVHIAKVNDMSFFDIGFPGSSTGKEFACNRGDARSSLVWNIPWRRDRLPTPVFLGFPAGSVVKESTCNVGDLGSIPGWEGPLKKGMAMYSCLENPHGQRSRWAAVHGVLKSQTQLSNLAVINLVAFLIIGRKKWSGMLSFHLVCFWTTQGTNVLPSFRFTVCFFLTIFSEHLGLI